MTIDEGRNEHPPVNHGFHLSAQLPLHHNGLAQIPHHCRYRIHPPFDLPLHFPLTREKDPKLIDLLHLGQDLLPDLVEGPWLQIWRCWFLSWPVSHSAVTPVQRALDVTDWWSQRDHIICKEQRPNPEVTKLDPLNTMGAPRNSVNL